MAGAVWLARQAGFACRTSRRSPLAALLDDDPGLSPVPATPEPGCRLPRRTHSWFFWPFESLFRKVSAGRCIAMCHAPDGGLRLDPERNGSRTGRRRLRHWRRRWLLPPCCCAPARLAASIQFGQTMPIAVIGGVMAVSPGAPAPSAGRALPGVCAFKPHHCGRIRTAASLCSAVGWCRSRPPP